jgi:hypothetical protein
MVGAQSLGPVTDKNRSVSLQGMSCEIGIDDRCLGKKLPLTNGTLFIPVSLQTNWSFATLPCPRLDSYSYAEGSSFLNMSCLVDRAPVILISGLSSNMTDKLQQRTSSSE